jgi:hypothetical protein
MTTNQMRLYARLKRLGFAQESQMRLYGEQFELVSDPIIMTDDAIFIDAIEKKSGQAKRVRIPLPILKMAKAELSTA